MGEHGACPWWIGRLLASPLRRFWSDPDAILADRIESGMIVLEPGPGMGFFTLEIARRVGASGKVIAVDQQRKMIDGLRRRVAKAGLAERVEARLSAPQTMGLGDHVGTVDFTFAFAVVHEMPDAGVFFREAADVSHAGARLMLVEPAGHVGSGLFDAELAAARAAGFAWRETPSIKGCCAAMFELERPIA